jgi:hypothetical protein
MSQIDILRNNLIDKLFTINNENVLKALETILSQSELGESEYKFSESQIDDLRESDKQIENGQTTESTELLAEARKWLKEKQA